ncbi:MAG TPA: spore germination protein [Clostridiales bacterium]|nr:spore germination protein [Clostridiales bacterium]
MSLYKRIRKTKRNSQEKTAKEVDRQNIQEIGMPADSSLDRNLDYFRQQLEDADDVVYREMVIGSRHDLRAVLMYVDGMVDKDLVNHQILKSLMLDIRQAYDSVQTLKEDMYRILVKCSITVGEISETQDLDQAILALLSGETLFLLDGYAVVLKIATRGWPSRGVEEPPTESVIRGPRDGFNETLRVNTTLIRRRIRDPRLKIKSLKIGQRSQTDVVIAYIKDVVDPNVLNEVKNRLKDIKIDGIFESGYIEQLIEDNWLSPFPQVQNTERPDEAAAALLEGRVAIIVDNTPFVLLVPTTLNSLFQSPEDYYERWLIASAIRVLRFIAGAYSLILPALYIAVTSFNPGIIPNRLVLSIAGSREGVPFPAYVEAIIMEVSLELLREAGVRLPGPIGQTIGIVGGLIIGQAAVQAGIVSPIMVIVVAITAIASFAIPSYNVAISFRILRFALILAAAFLGLYGLVLGLLAIIVHLATLKSFGVPYLPSFDKYNIKNFQDFVIRAPLMTMKQRPMFLEGRDKTRAQDERPEEKEAN